MRKPEIIATIGVLYNYDDCSLYEELLHEGICQIRYNLGKFWDNPTELKLRLDQIQKIYERYGKDKILGYENRKYYRLCNKCRCIN